MVLAATVWHYWIGVVLALVLIPLVIGTVVGYFRKVVQPRYPRR